MIVLMEMIPATVIIPTQKPETSIQKTSNVLICSTLDRFKENSNIPGCK